MSAVSNNDICWVCYCLNHMLTTTTASQITFPSDEATCLVLTSWLDISLHRSHSFGASTQPRGLMKALTKPAAKGWDARWRDCAWLARSSSQP